jgi:hypothetical protein
MMEQIKIRRSIRKYLDKSIEDAKIIESVKLENRDIMKELGRGSSET